MKNKIISVSIFGLIIIYIFIHNFSFKNSQPLPSPTPINPTITSTNPLPLEGALISPTQSISVSFSQPLQNLPEFRYKMDPTVDLNVKLSDDRKTVTFTPKKFFDLSAAYTLFVYRDSKFDNKKLLDQDYIFHFHTPTYTGV